VKGRSQKRYPVSFTDWHITPPRISPVKAVYDRKIRTYVLRTGFSSTVLIQPREAIRLDSFSSLACGVRLSEVLILQSRSSHYQTLVVANLAQQSSEKLVRIQHGFILIPIFTTFTRLCCNHQENACDTGHATE
jgi:hypothetical protein